MTDQLNTNPPPVASIEAALRMLDVFASVGADRFDITHTNIDQERRGYRPDQGLQAARGSMPHLLASALRRQNNVIIRPRARRPQEGLEATGGGLGVTIIQLDDLDASRASKTAPVAFLTLATSPGSYQAWVAVLDAPLGLTARLRRGAGADPNASGATRVAGTLNYKRKYEPDFPMVRVARAKPGRVVTVDQLDELGLLAPAPQVEPAAAISTRSGTSKWPDYDRCLQNAPIGEGGTPKRTSVDFTFCMIALSWGHTVDATVARLMECSTKAQENGERYARMTAERAEWAARKRSQQPRP